MRNRRRLILSLLDRATGPVEGAMLVLLVFRLRHETDVRCCDRGRLAMRIAADESLPVTHL